MEIFAIPTHRLVETALMSLVKEVQKVEQTSNSEIVIIIIDNSSYNIANKNKSLVMQLKNKLKNRIYYLNLKQWYKIIKKISDISGICLGELIELLYSNDVDYGKIFNIIFILVSMLGGDTFHRRDSDCVIKNEDYPSIEELKFIGKKINDIGDMVNFENENPFLENDEIMIVGSDYSGDWNLELKELQMNNNNTLNSLLELLFIPKEEMQQYIKSKYTNSFDNSINKACFDGFGGFHPECGNISMYKIFKYIPNFIGSYGIGFDYHTYNMASILQIPVLYHTKKIMHIHNSERKTQNAQIKYWEGMVKVVDYIYFLNKFTKNNQDKLLELGNTGIQRLLNLSNNSLADMLLNNLETLDLDERIYRIDTIVNDILLPSKINYYITIAELLNKSKFDLINQLDVDYKRSIKLQRYWGKIIYATKRLHLDEFEYEYIS